MASWPTTLPAPKVEGYALNPVNPSIRTDMEAGAARTRTRTKARNDKVSVAWIFNDAQMAIFRAWYDNPAECAYGSAWFTVSLLIGTGGSVSSSARFTEIWKATYIGGKKWQVTSTLEVR